MAGRSAGALVAVGALALTLPAAFLWGLSALDVPVLPGAASVPVAAPSSSASPRPVAVISDSPATRALATVLTGGPGSPWVATGPIDWAVTTPYDTACGRTSGPGAVVSASRTYTDGTAQVIISARAYGAGAGAVAFERLSSSARACAGAGSVLSATETTLNGASAIDGSLRPEGFPATVASLAWRRGDVIVEAHSAAGDRLRPAAEAVDGRVTEVLVGVCRSLDSSIDDADRSPWVNRDRYAGLRVQQDITLPPPSQPTPPAGATVRDPAARLEPVPDVTLPPRPADPVWPELPTAPPTPVVPSPLEPAPTTTSATTLRRDEVGPGCGWAFTVNSLPPFDQKAADAANAAAVDQATLALQTDQASWSQRLVQFWVDATAYDLALGPYRLYAAQVQQVTTAWAALQQARDIYATELADWQEAVNARTALLAEQQRAASDYNAALAACVTATPSAPSPTPTTTPSPSTSVDPGGLPSPTATAPPVACPPDRPSVLDVTIPPVPPTPTPPPDPRPSASTSSSR